MSIYGVIIGILAAVILFLNWGLTVTAFCAAGIVILVIIAAITSARAV